METHEMPCGCAYTVGTGYGAHLNGQFHYRVANRVEFVRRCAVHTPKKSHKRKAPKLPGKYAQLVTLGYFGGRSYGAYDRRAEAQRRAYEKLMGRPFEPEPLSVEAEALRHAQFDYTGAVRYEYDDAWTKIKLTRDDQLARIVPGFAQ